MSELAVETECTSVIGMFRNDVLEVNPRTREFKLSMQYCIS